MKLAFARPVSFLALVALVLLIGCGKTPYDNPIDTASDQPDKILFDKSIAFIEKHRYELARINLQTMINTYPDSEYIAKAKLAIADSWYREGTSHALAQAEAEYKDFITFFPSMEEAAESQMKVCQIHYEQMVKPDRDNTHAVRADQECRQAIMQWPNSVFVDDTKQMLREVQEVIAEAEYRVGSFYSAKGSYRSGANRLQAMADHYPLYSKNDQALWLLGETYEKMGEQFEQEAVDAYSRIVRDYPLSPLVEDAKRKLSAFNAPIPEANSDRQEVMAYNMDRREQKGVMKKTLTIFSTAPDVRMAAKMGDPAMTTLMPTTPPGIRPVADRGPAQPSADVSVETISGPSALDTEPDARRNQPGPQQEGQQEQPAPQQPQN